MNINVNKWSLLPILSNYVSEPAYGVWLEWKGSMSKSKMRVALYAKTRAMILSDRLLTNRLDELQ